MYGRVLFPLWSNWDKFGKFILDIHINWLPGKKISVSKMVEFHWIYVHLNESLINFGTVNVIISVQYIIKAGKNVWHYADKHVLCTVTILYMYAKLDHSDQYLFISTLVYGGHGLRLPGLFISVRRGGYKDRIGYWFFKWLRSRFAAFRIKTVALYRIKEIQRYVLWYRFFT